jgi:hypothetical protein
MTVSPHGTPKEQRGRDLSPCCVAADAACDQIVSEFAALIDRRFAAHRTLLVSNDEGKFWTAAIGDNVLYRSPDGAATLRFARTFAERNAGVTVEVAEDPGFSVRVPERDNVVSIIGRVEA